MNLHIPIHWHPDLKTSDVGIPGEIKKEQHDPFLRKNISPGVVCSILTPTLTYWWFFVKHLFMPFST